MNLCLYYICRSPIQLDGCGKNVGCGITLAEPKTRCDTSLLKRSSRGHHEVLPLQQNQSAPGLRRLRAEAPALIR